MRLRAIVLLVFVAAPATAQDTLKSVVVVDKRLATLVDQGRSRASTFRILVDQLEASNWVVFLQPGSCPDRAAIGCLLHVVGRFDGRPYVRILVNPNGRHPDTVIATLAHELQHACEVATAGTVTDGPSMIALLRRIASSRTRVATAVLYETAAARQVEEAVHAELRSR
jgi:hypothetical protein